jgi:hypothetical protein
LEHGACPKGGSAEVRCCVIFSGNRSQWELRATKRLPALAKKFMDTARREMGVTVFMLVQYENVDENGSLAK